MGAQKSKLNQKAIDELSYKTKCESFILSQKISYKYPQGLNFEGFGGYPEYSLNMNKAITIK